MYLPLDDNDIFKHKFLNGRLFVVIAVPEPYDTKSPVVATVPTLYHPFHWVSGSATLD